ncbi:MAG: hypothetical protein IT370_34745 [Deltaproteobacteria bacterium]|nr:hypothetical protein [Deltaproteobacteria bacterium]
MGSGGRVHSFALLAVWLAGCVDAQSYRCGATARCIRGGVTGTCEPEGFCSFPDPACPRGRWAPLSPRAGTCVGDGPGVDAALPDAALPDADLVDRLDVDAAPPVLDGGNASCYSRLTSRVTHSCIVRSDGSAFCWGRDGYNQLGGRPSLGPGVPLRGDPPTTARIIAGEVGAEHTALLDADGHMWCVGANFNGQCGDGTTTSHFGDYASPRTATPAAELTGITMIAAGRWHTCVLAGGQIYCTGANDEAQVGYATPVTEPNRTWSVNVAPVAVTGATALVAGQYHTCALVAAGAVTCWGDNDGLQLGRMPATDSLVPMQVAGITGATRLALGGEHSCALVGTEVWCWGNNDRGQLGDFTASRATPMRITSLPPVVSLAAGGQHTCAVSDAGKVLCWGDNTVSQLGQPAIAGDNRSRTPLEVPAIGDALEVSAGDDFTCVLRRAGVSCWGRNDSSQLGAASPGESALPIPVQLTCP